MDSKQVEEGEQQSTITNTIVSMFSNSLKKRNDTLAETIYKITSPFLENYKDFWEKVLDSLKPVFENLKNYELGNAKEILELGFYPSKYIKIDHVSYLKKKSIASKERYIFSQLDELMRYKRFDEMARYFKSNNIRTSFLLFKKRKYDLFILKMIVTISQITNEKFDGISVDERYKIYQNIDKFILKNNYITLNKKKDYVIKHYKEKGIDRKNVYLFSPYYFGITGEKYDKLFISYKYDEEFKSKYLKIPYNRNAIIHGYVKRYGTKKNCLRWLSVLLNVYELSQKFDEVGGLNNE